MCNVEVVLQKQTMNCFKVPISSFEFLNSLKENFYNSSMAILKPNSKVFLLFAL